MTRHPNPLTAKLMQHITGKIEAGLGEAIVEIPVRSMTPEQEGHLRLIATEAFRHRANELYVEADTEYAMGVAATLIALVTDLGAKVVTDDLVDFSQYGPQLKQRVSGAAEDYCNRLFDHCRNNEDADTESHRTR